MAIPEHLDPKGRSFSWPQDITVRTRQPANVGQLLRSLGLTLTKQTTAGGAPYFTAECHGLKLKVFPTADVPSDPKETTLHLAVDSLEGTLAAAAPFQAPILRPVHQSPWGRRAIIADPEGRRIILSDRSSIPPAPEPEPQPPSRPQSQSIVISLPGEMPVTMAIDTKPKKKPEDAETPADVLPAIAAAKRGIAMMTIGGIVIGTLSVIQVIEATQQRDSHRLNNAASFASLFSQLLSVIVLLLLIFPRSRRLKYGAIWAAFGISFSATVILILTGQDIGDRDTMLMLGNFVGLVGLVSPILMYHYLRQLAGKAEDASLTRLVNIVMKLYLTTIELVFTAVPMSLVSNTAAMVLVVGGCVGSLAYLVGLVVLTVRLLRFRPIRPKKTEIFFAPAAIDADGD